MKKIITYVAIFAVVAAVAILLWGVWQNFYGEVETVNFRTDKVARGDVMQTISSTGTVEPEELVNVGAQVSGKIMSFGTDCDGKVVDYGSKVSKGMVLAKIDEVLYEAALSEAKAQKLQAEVSILSADANLNQANAKFSLAERNWTRAQELYPKGSLSKSNYDAAEAEYLTTKANIEVAKASVLQAKAQKEIADAALVKAERNLSYCVIASPVDGIIIDRRVSVGQTLVSNMSASSIFLIATDLKKMQVWASVNEADIGEVYIGMPVVFSVDAFPDESFSGIVNKIRLNATMSQNVVTYVVEISTDNSSGRLLPYLTANVQFVKKQSKNTLTVPNAALRYTPEEEMISPEFRQAERQGSYVWLLQENQLLKPVAVKRGISSGTVVEVFSDELKEGDVIVTGHDKKTVSAADSKPEQQKSPFAPDMPKRVKNSAKGV